MDNQEDQGAGSEKNEPELEIDEYKLMAYMEEMASNQKPVGAVLGGIIGAAIGSGLWAIISVLINYEVGYVAIAIGFIVGFFVRFMGSGITVFYGVIGAVFALVGCLAGKILAAVAITAKAEELSFISLLASLNLEFIIFYLRESFDLYDGLFYAIAVWAGYKYSIKGISEEDLEKLAK